MKNIITNEEKQFIIVKVDANGEAEGVLTRRTSTYGASMAVSPFNLKNLSVAVTRANTFDLQLVLDGFLMDRKTYKYDDIYNQSHSYPKHALYQQLPCYWLSHIHRLQVRQDFYRDKN